MFERCRDARDVAGLGHVRLFEPAHRDLRARAAADPAAAHRVRIERAEVEIRAVFVRLAPLKRRRFNLPRAGAHARRHDAVRDVSRVELVMRERGRRDADSPTRDA